MTYKNNTSKYFFSLIILSLITLAPTQAQSDHRYRMEGDRNYQEQDFQAAEESYRKSLQEKSNPKGRYNLGNAIYQQNRYDEAVRQYLEAADRAKTEQLKADAYHNLGNAYYNNQDFQNSIEAYKNALRINPTDPATKQNLALAQRQLLQQQRQQQQQQNQEQNENEEQNQQQQQQQQQEQQQQQNQDENQNQNDQQQDQEQQLEQKDLTKEEAQKLLEIMENEEQRVQEKLRKGKRQKTKSDKDW